MINNPRKIFRKKTRAVSILISGAKMQKGGNPAFCLYNTYVMYNFILTEMH
jgi:hypothetical protein